MKFDNVKTDNDTVITLNLETMFGKYDVLYQQWVWDGIQGYSLIFDNDDISDTELGELTDDVRNSALVNDVTEEITSKVGEQYTFVNFNFETL
jgi:hypothetical protein